MIPIGQTLTVERKDAANLIKVSVHMMEVWSSTKSHAILHKGAFKIRGKCFYLLGDIENFLKEWDKARYYDIYTDDGKGFIKYLAKLSK